MWKCMASALAIAILALLSDGGSLTAMMKCVLSSCSRDDFLAWGWAVIKIFIMCIIKYFGALFVIKKNPAYRQASKKFCSYAPSPFHRGSY